MASVASYLADTSALARLRHRPVATVLGPLIEAGLVATCGVIESELGWATGSGKEFHELRADRDAGYEWLPLTMRTGGAPLRCRRPSGTVGRSGQLVSQTC